MQERSRESASIEQFIRDRQVVLIERAIATLTVAADDELGFQFHRLVGSLGSYQLHEASRLLRELELRAEAPSASTPDALRSHAVSGLKAIAAAMEAAA